MATIVEESTRISGTGSIPCRPTAPKICGPCCVGCDLNRQRFPSSSNRILGASRPSTDPLPSPRLAVTTGMCCGRRDYLPAFRRHPASKVVRRPLMNRDSSDDGKHTALDLSAESTNGVGIACISGKSISAPGCD